MLKTMFITKKSSNFAKKYISIKRACGSVEEVPAKVARAPKKEKKSENNIENNVEEK